MLFGLIQAAAQAILGFLLFLQAMELIKPEFGRYLLFFTSILFTAMGVWNLYCIFKKQRNGGNK